MAISKVVGFSVIKGGRDLPSGFDESENFGFDLGDDGQAVGPIFQFSIDDVRANFQKCYSMEMQSQISVGCTVRLYAETSDNLELKSVNFISDLFWKKAFKIIEWTIENQSNILSLNSSDENYLNYADQHLGAELINDEVNPERIDTYIPKSFIYIPSSNATRENRISQFSFQATINDSTVLFQIHLDADDFCSTITEDLSKSVYVFMFDEITYDGKLDNEELYQSINKPLFEAYKQRRYKRLDVLDTRWFKRKNPTTPDDGYESEAVTRRFHIYSNFKTTPDSAFPVESRMEAVKNALIEKYGEEGPDGNKIVTDDLITQYPDLFSRSEVLLVPFNNNNSLQITGGDLIQGMHPITPLKIINTAKKYGYSVQTDSAETSGKSKIEIFYVGGETPNEDNTNIFRFPIMAIEKIGKTTFPISNRFPNYTPKYFDNEWPSTSQSDQFQFVLAKALGALDGKYTEEQLNSLSSTVNFVVSKNESGIITSISFQFLGVKWIIDNESIDDKVR